MVVFKKIPKTWLKFGLLWLVAFAVLSAVMISDYFYYFNYLEIFPGELLLPTIFNMVITTLCATVIYFLPWPRLLAPKLLSVTVLTLSLTNYDNRLNLVADTFRGLIPVLPVAPSDTPVISIFYFAVLGLMAVLIGIALEKMLKTKKYSQYSGRAIEFILVVVAVVGVWQAYHLLAVFPSVYRQSKTVAPVISGSPQTDPTKPDIYYIVLDRYTNDSVLKSQFNFDNSSFLNSLKDAGFTVDNDAYSNYPLTSISISSTLNATYTNNIVARYKDNDVQSRTLYHNLIRQSSVVKAIKADGYKFYQIGADYGATNKAPLADGDFGYSVKISAFGVTRYLKSFETTEYAKSPLKQLFKVSLGWWPFASEEKDKIKFVGDQLAALNSFANKQPAGGRFIFAHILMPHDPFVFNKDGSISQYQATDNYGKPIKTKYLDQLQYINSEISKTIQSIIKNSNDQAVIILNADEGAYPQDMNSTAFSMAVPLDYMSKSNMSIWPSDWLKMKFGILQAVHIPRASQDDLQNLSSVNLFRIVLNNYFGYKLTYLPDCSFGFSRGDRYEYNYKDITGVIQGRANTQCQQYQSL